MKALLSIVLWIVGLLAIGLSCILVILLSFVLKPKALDVVLKTCTRLIFVLLLSPVTVEGREKLGKDRTYLFMANHVSLLDVPLLASTTPKMTRGVLAEHQFHWPLYGWVLRRLHNIPIDRKNIHSSIRSIREAQKILKGGLSLIILPEGHRTLDGKLGSFKKLPFFLAKETGIDVVPIGMSGLFRMKSKKSWLIRPTHLTVKFGEVISNEQIKSLTVLELQTLVRRRIEQLIDTP